MHPTTNHKNTGKRHEIYRTVSYKMSIIMHLQKLNEKTDPEPRRSLIGGPKAKNDPLLQAGVKAHSYWCRIQGHRSGNFFHILKNRTPCTDKWYYILKKQDKICIPKTLYVKNLEQDQ